MIKLTEEELRINQKASNRKSYMRNRESVLERCKAYYRENKEAVSAYQKKYREANKESIREYQKFYREQRKINLLNN